MPQPDIKLTQFSRGAGCGCKIAPQVLHEILHSSPSAQVHPNLLVGYGTNDDAAVYDTGGDDLLVATADFFTPIVNDPFSFGAVAAANAISDVYAMGGRPALALGLLGWPVEKLGSETAKAVLDGAKSVCATAGIPLAGGHSIDTQEPLFGLSVNGFVKKNRLKRNDTARDGDILFLTKPIGSGILSTALKRGIISEADEKILLEVLTKLNDAGAQVSAIGGLNAMTDVTGFGVMGHLIEMANGSGLTALLRYEALPRLGVAPYIAQHVLPDATFRNWNAYLPQTAIDPGVDMSEAFMLLPDPQTNGGLLLSVESAAADEVIGLLRALKLHAEPIGEMRRRAEKALQVQQ